MSEETIAKRPGRSHPPSLLRIAERSIRDFELIEKGEVVLVACSGGPDSSALLHVLAYLRKRFRYDVVACGVDHGLRPEASLELDKAEAFAERLDVRFHRVRVQVPAGGNLQERARHARYCALEQVAHESSATKVATGHTADDRAETFLLRLLRGSGPRGLAVLPDSAAFPRPRGAEPSALALIRPIIRARRMDVMAHVKRHEIPFSIDPSNRSQRFSRVRVRNELVPLMQELSPRIVDHLCDLSDMLIGMHGVFGEEPTGLGRAQRQMIHRARDKGRKGGVIRLKGGKDVEFTFAGEHFVLMEGERPRG